jgi:PAS domain-containing protein
MQVEVRDHGQNQWDRGARSQEFRTLAEHSPDSIARLDPSGRYTYVNQAASDLVGLTSDQLVGKVIAEVGLDQHVYALLAEALQSVVATHRPRTLQVDVHLPLGQVQSQGQGRGQVRSFHARFIPELDNGGALVSVLAFASRSPDLALAARRPAVVIAPPGALLVAPAGIWPW